VALDDPRVRRAPCINWLSRETVTDTPARFGPFLLEHRLAVGGMGELFLSRRVEPDGPNGGIAGRPCVVKRILPELTRDPEFVARFHDEVRIAVSLRHECILRVLEVGVCGGRHYLAMEFVDGLDLRQLLGACWRSRRVLPVPVAVYIAYQVLGALAYAHELRDASGRHLDLVHRDVSPSNVLVSRQGDVKLIDFGLAKTRAAAVSTRPTVLFGKVGYLSPEQARGQHVDQRADIYSVGAILYELLTGERLVRAETTVDLLERVVEPRFEPLTSLRPSLPAVLGRAVERALAPSPHDRYTCAESFRVALEPFLEHPLPELRAHTGQTVVELVGAGQQPCLAVAPSRSHAAIEVEGSRELTARREDSRGNTRRRHVTPDRFRANLGTVYGELSRDGAEVDPLLLMMAQRLDASEKTLVQLAPGESRRIEARRRREERWRAVALCALGVVLFAVALSTFLH
jgi:serine/threonine protein kinase